MYLACMSLFLHCLGMTVYVGYGSVLPLTLIAGIDYIIEKIVSLVLII